MADIKSINGNPIVPESVADGAVGVDGLAEDVIELLDEKADIDGYYSQLTAGLAENLIGRGDAVPAEYLYRTAGGTADIEDGIATIDCIKGNTLVWNQLIPALDSNWGVYGVADATFDTTNNSVTLKTAETGGQSVCRVYNTSAKTIVGHKYYMSCVIDTSMLTSPYTAVAGMHTSNGNGTGIEPRLIIAGGKTKARYSLVLESSQEGGFGLGISFAAPNDQYAVFQNPQLFDLTLMFGAGNEPSTVEEFEEMFPLPYYPYSAPKMLPVDMRGIETVGFNLWDEEWESGGYANGTGAKTSHVNQIRSTNPIRVLPNTEYYVRMGDETYTDGLVIIFYDAGMNFLSNMTSGIRNRVFTTPADCHYINFMIGNNASPCKTYKGDICINLSWSGYRNGEYEEYWSAERPIDTSQYFPTGLKKVGDKSDALYADHYDTVVGSVDLGTLNWTKIVSGESPYFSGALSGIKYSSSQNNYVCDANYAHVSVGSTGDSSGIYVTDASSVRIRDNTYSDAADFKAAMSGVILYYELATPTTTPIDPPLNLSYKVSDFGTERIMVDETADAPQSAPVPMEVEYGINAIDTIRRLPTEYQSHKSMGQLTAALESSLGIDITETWDEDDQRYEYEATPFELADDSIPDAKLAQTGGILSTVASVTELDTETETTNTQQDVTQESGYYWNGSAQSSSSYVYAHLTNLVEGDIITAEYGSYPYQLAWIRFVDAYSGSTRDADASGNYTTTATSYIVPSGVDNVYVSVASAAQPVFYIQRTTTTSTLMPKDVPELNESVSRISQWVSSNHGVSAFAQSLASGETLTIAERIDNKKNCTYEVWAEFDAFDTLTIGHGIGAGIAGSWVVIDETNITAYYFNGSTTYSYGPWVHGLTISEFLQVSVTKPNVNPANKATVTLMTGGGSFTQDVVEFAGCNGDVTVSATMDITDVKASYIINDMLSDVYLFGDSYVGLDAARYPYHLLARDANDLLISGFSGARSEDEIVSLANILQVHKPKYIVWALGMNNRDNNDSYNNGWKRVLDVVLAECEKYGIVPILATIPNTPTVSNVYKNEWVQQSGYRYVDFAKAVGAESAGSTWYAGMLSSDNVHPTELGAKALAARFLIDVPEVL